MEACRTCDRIFNYVNFILVCRHCGLNFYTFDTFKSHFDDFNLNPKKLICQQDRLKAHSYDDEDDIKKEEPSAYLDLSEITPDKIILAKSLEVSESKEVTEKLENGWLIDPIHGSDHDGNHQEDPDYEYEVSENSDDDEYDDEDYISSRALEINPRNNNKPSRIKRAASSRRKRRIPYLFKCLTCGEEFPKRPFLEAHNKSSDCCKICKVDLRHEDLRVHMKEVHGESMPEHLINCTHCDKEFRNPKAFNWHFRRIHSKDVKFHQCQYCDYKSPDKFKVRLHYRLRHETNPKKDFRCLVCGFETILKGTMKNHIINRHGEDAWEAWQNHDWKNHDWSTHHFTETAPASRKKGVGGNSVREINSTSSLARQNGQSFSGKSKAGGGKRPERSMCDICGKTFSSRNNCIFHYKRVHTKELKLHSCSICDYKSPDTYKVKLHTRLIHQPDAKKDFICHVCGKEFALKGNLKGHVKAVHGEALWDSWTNSSKTSS